MLYDMYAHTIASINILSPQLEAKCRTKDPELQLEGLHGLWEFMVNKDYHPDLTLDQIKIVVQSIIHDDVHCAIVAAAAVWSLVAVQDSRRKATDLRAVEILLQGARRSRMWEIHEELRHQYQTCIFGALSVMFVDQVCRERYCEVEPDFETLFSFCDVHDGAIEHFEADRRSFVSRILCMIAHRDATIRRSIVLNDCVQRILDLTHTDGPGSNHVNLCMMTIIAILVLDEDAMELLRIRKQAPIVFEACVKQLGICIEMLDPDSGKSESTFLFLSIIWLYCNLAATFFVNNSYITHRSTAFPSPITSQLRSAWIRSWWWPWPNAARRACGVPATSAACPRAAAFATTSSSICPRSATGAWISCTWASAR